MNKIFILTILLLLSPLNGDKLSNLIMNNQKINNFTGQKLNKLYGYDFKNYTLTQQTFLNANLKRIYHITLKTLIKLSYPKEAIKQKFQDKQLISFYLNPNGKISGLHFKKSLGYHILEKNTIKAIKLAQKFYPRPKTKTKIIFYIDYRL